MRRKEIGEEHRYRIAGYEKPVTYNKLGLFDLMKRGPVAVTMGLDPQYFQYYRNDRDGEFYFNSSSNQPSVYGVVVEYSQFVADGKDELAKYPYFAVETRLRACNSMVFRLPILDTVENANVGGIAGLAIRPIVSELLPTPEPPTDTPSEELPPTDTPSEEPAETTEIPTSTTVPPTQKPTKINWAVLICGSKGYDNYRHHADIAHAYQILKTGGLDPDHIITMMYNDASSTTIPATLRTCMKEWWSIMRGMR